METQIKVGDKTFTIKRERDVREIDPQGTGAWYWSVVIEQHVVEQNVKYLWLTGCGLHFGTLAEARNFVYSRA